MFNNSSHQQLIKENMEPLGAGLRTQVSKSQLCWVSMCLVEKLAKVLRDQGISHGIPNNLRNSPEYLYYAIVVNY